VIGDRLSVDRGRVLAALWIAALALAAFAIVTATRHLGVTLLGGSPVDGGLWIGAAATVSVAGLFLWRIGRRVSSGWFALLAIAWCLGEWNNPGVGSPLVFAVGRGVHPVALAVVAHAALSYPSGRLPSRAARATVTLGYLDATLLLGLPPILFYEPLAHGCAFCPPDPFLFTDAPGISEALTAAGAVVQVAWAIAVVALAAMRVVTSGHHPLERASSPVLVAGGAVVAVTAVVEALAVMSVRDGPIVAPLPPGPLDAVGLNAIAIAVAWMWVERRRTRRRVTAVVLGLAAVPWSDGLETHLAGIVGDPSLRLAYPVADRDQPVDAAGRPVPVPPGRHVTPVVRGNETLALLIHERDGLDDSVRLDEIARAARLALDHERHAATLEVQIADLRASRARLVAMGDVERRRLERDLHDGAQQRLVELSMSIAATRTVVGPEADRLLARAEADLHAAIDELRVIARGLHPAVLATDGLAAAVDSLRDDSSIPIAVAAIPSARLPLDVESVAYAVIAEAAGPIAAAVGATGVRVEARLDRSSLLLTVRLASEGAVEPKGGARLMELEDRLGAIDGTLRVAQADGELRLEAVVPCVS
jgi:signal transduction histidine kinase